MGAFFGPAQMLRDFKDVRFDVGGNRISVSINNYRNNSYAKGKAGSTADALTVKDALLQAAGSKVALGAAGGGSAYVGVFTGKGTPATIAKVLPLFYEHRENFKKMFSKAGGPAGAVAGYLADSAMSWQDAMQRICDDLIGLDCNGFVGCWMSTVAPEFKLNGNQHRPLEFYNARKQTRKTVDQIEYWDVIIWENMSHIAAINDPVAGQPGVFNVCQSAGGGPRSNAYRFVQAGPGKFRLDRIGGAYAGDVGGTVYVISHWPA